MSSGNVASFSLQMQLDVCLKWHCWKSSMTLHHVVSTENLSSAARDYGHIWSYWPHQPYVSFSRNFSSLIWQYAAVKQCVQSNATDKMVEKIVKDDSWPIQPHILNPPLLRLTYRKPLWLELQPVDIKSWWRHNWKSAQVVNSHLVCDPTIWQPGFDLSWQQWSLLNHFRTE